jgi:hypothetical protein
MVQKLQKTSGKLKTSHLAIVAKHNTLNYKHTTLDQDHLRISTLLFSSSDMLNLRIFLIIHIGDTAGLSWLVTLRVIRRVQRHSIVEHVGAHLAKLSRHANDCYGSVAR